jgi:RNA polymerase sigma factor (sigma-70 family)
MTPAAIFPNWPSVVQQISDGDPVGFETLYRALGTFRSRFRRQVGAERCEDMYHDLIVQLVCQIRRGQLRDPERLVGYAGVMASRQFMACVEDLVHERNSEVQADTFQLCDKAESAEKHVIAQEGREIAERMLHAMPRREREVLTRFYLDEESPESIQSSMGLSPTQFRLIKTRAKTRFTKMSKRRLNTPGVFAAER